MKEVWKPIKGYEGLYEVSNKGRIKSLSRIKISKHGTPNVNPTKERILKDSKNKHGYRQLRLFINGKKKSVYSHQIVAIAFIPNPNNFTDINHLNGIRYDNRVENLEWCDDHINLSHLHRELRKRKRGITKDGSNKYVATLGYYGKTFRLGRFKTKKEGYAAYRKKYLELYRKEPW